jgi:nucleoside-diphosphate-sugar epimerase
MPAVDPGFTRALVTGADGFIGRALVRRLVGAGVAVTATSRRTNPPPVKGVSWAVGDLTDAEFAQDVVARGESPVLFHLAGKVTGSRDLDMVLPTLGDTLVTTVNLLVAATRSGCERIVLIGSAEEPYDRAPATSPYATAKWAAREYGRLFHAVYRTPVTMARPLFVYGPDQPDTSKLIPHTIRSLLAGVAPSLSSGRRRCDWVFIEDVVDGLVAAATVPDCIGQNVDLGTGILTSARHVVETICELIGTDTTPHWGALPDREAETEVVADAPALWLVGIDRPRQRSGAHCRVVRRSRRRRRLGSAGAAAGRLGLTAGSPPATAPLLVT